MNAPSPDPISAARWRAIALALAATSAVLSGLLFLTVAEPAPPTQVEAGATSDVISDAEDASAGEVEAGASPVTRKGIEGVIQLEGTPPGMRIPRQRMDAEFCKLRPLLSNAVLVKDRGLKDVLIRIENGTVKSEYKLPDKRLALQHKDCLYAPRVQGAMVGQGIELSSPDPAFHNTHGFKGNQTWLNLPHPRGGASAVRVFDTSGIYKFTCDLHVWERAFVVVSDHPFFAVTDEDGAFAIPDVPAGRYMVEAWHARYGLRRVAVEVGDTPAVVKVTYQTTDPEPEINRGESLEPF